MLVYRHAWRQRATERPLSAKGLVRADMRGHGRWLPFWSCSQQALRRGQSRILPKRAPRARRDRAFTIQLCHSATTCQVVECILTPPVPHRVPLVQPVPGGTKLQVAPEGLAVLRSLHTAVSPVVVIGPYRSGKSFMLNQLLGVGCGAPLLPNNLSILTSRLPAVPMWHRRSKAVLMCSCCVWLTTRMHSLCPLGSPDLVPLCGLKARKSSANRHSVILLSMLW